MVQVIFTYDETDGRWESQVTGAENCEEARHAFSAVVITCQMLDRKLLQHARISDDHVVIPAV